MADFTFWSEILSMTNSEPIEAVALGTLGGGYVGHEVDESDPREAFPASLRNIPISAEQAEPLLSYDYDRGYGGADCHPVFVYTASRVIFVHEYDGSTSVVWVPRHPVAGPVDLSGLDEWSGR